MRSRFKDIIVVGDAHTARLWDRISGKFPHKKDFLNPNALLRKLVKKIKFNQILVTNGDMVDYYYSDYIPGKDNNLDLSDQILKSFKGKKLANTGNHEYRSWAYNISIPGLQHVNLEREFIKEHRHTLGYSFFRALHELKSINLFHSRHDRAAHEYIHKNYSEAVDGRRLIFMDTGPDAATTWGLIFRLKYWRFLLKIEPPISYGFTVAQQHYLRDEIQNAREAEIILFVHCPPFFAKRDGYEVKIKKNKDILPQIYNSDFGSCFFARGQDRLMRLVMESEKNILVVSSHVHAPSQAVLHKATGLLKSVSMADLNKTMKDPGWVKFATTLPLGGLSSYNRKVGYLTIKDHTLSHVVMRDFTR